MSLSGPVHGHSDPYSSHEWEARLRTPPHAQPDLGRTGNRGKCSFHFETPDNAGNEQRGVLGGATLEEAFVLRCLSARTITETAENQARHAPLASRSGPQPRPPFRSHRL